MSRFIRVTGVAVASAAAFAGLSLLPLGPGRWASANVCNELGCLPDDPPPVVVGLPPVPCNPNGCDPGVVVRVPVPQAGCAPTVDTNAIAGQP